MDHPNNAFGHRTVRIEVHPWSAEIDEAIAPLIRGLWTAGIETTMSCQEDAWGKVWIAFPEIGNLVQFLNIVAEYQPGAETLYNRMNPQLTLAAPESEWEYGLIVDDGALILSDAEVGSADFRYDGPTDFFFTFSLRFPASDLPRVLARVQEHNRPTEPKVK